MRRLVSVFCLALLAVCSAPVPAHAYFWEWLDSLSGPRFGGVIGELELVCPVKSDLALSTSALESIETQLGVEKQLHDDADKTFVDPEARRFLGNARGYRTQAEDVLKEARRLVTDALRAVDRKDKRRARASATVVTALAWQERAAAHFAWARLLEQGKELDPRKQPGSYDIGSMSSDDEIVAKAFPIGGVKYSLCQYRALERDRVYFSGNVGFAVDIKNDDEHSNGRHWMLTVGGSAHVVVTPWLTGGAGVGRALFFPSGEGSGNFGKWYVQPYIIDVKPGAMVKRANLRSPWRHFVYLRYSMITFPQGFEERRFSPNSPTYEQEWIQQVGIHFDLAPVLRARKGNW